MDYEEKYNIALANAEAYHNITTNTEVKNWLEYTFPELKESEDERIRKEIIQFLQLPHPQFVGKRNYEECIAWLEKQGGKVDVLDDFPTEFERQISHLIASSVNKEWEYKKDFVKHTANALLQYAKNELEKQGEQKPIEWSDEDEKFFITALWHISNSVSNGKDTEGHCATTEWLKSLKDRILSQPHQDWSKEDKDYYDAIIAKLEVTQDDASLTDNQMKFLKSLKDKVKPQQHQGWSEEDEEMYNEVLTDIIYTKNDMKTKGCLGLSNRAMKAFNWFSKRHKSLRFQSKWKPSEEQMEAIKYFIDFHKPQANASTEGWNEFKHLESLYNELRRLKEN